MKTTTVAHYIERQIALSDRTQRSIAAECGYPNSNVLSMMKSGAIKVPLEKVEVLARSLNVDPKHLLRLVMAEYMPAAWGVIESIVGCRTLLTEQEMELVDLLRSCCAGTVPDLGIDDARGRIGATLRAATDATVARQTAAVDRMNRLPRNARRKD